MNRHTILVLILISVFCILMTFRYLNQSTCANKTHITEGFAIRKNQEPVEIPKPEGISTVPNQIPGSTTLNSTDNNAPLKDIIAYLNVSVFLRTI